jgi:hypothetical protein
MRRNWAEIMMRCRIPLLQIPALHGHGRAFERVDRPMTEGRPPPSRVNRACQHKRAKFHSFIGAYFLAFWTINFCSRRKSSWHEASCGDRN